MESAPTFDAAVALVRGPWRGPPLGHGDLVRVAGGSTSLSVFDAERGHLVPVPDRGPRSTSVARWEGARAVASDMLFVAAAAGSRATAACLALSRGALCSALSRGALAQMATCGADLPVAVPKSLAALAAVDRWAAGGGSSTPLERLELLEVARVQAALEAVSLGERADELGGRDYDSPGHRSARSVAAAASACTSTVEFALHATTTTALAEVAARSVALYAAESLALGDDEATEAELRRMAPTVRDVIPLSVVACALVGARIPVGIPNRGASRR